MNNLIHDLMKLDLNKFNANAKKSQVPMSQKVSPTSTPHNYHRQQSNPPSQSAGEFNIRRNSAD